MGKDASECGHFLWGFKLMEAMERGIMADRICDLLAYHDMSQAGLARAANVTDEAVQRYGSGVRMPNGSILLNIANALGTSKGYPFGRTDELFAVSEDAGK